MKIAIVGSRGITVSYEKLEELLPKDTTELVSGGARGVDTCAELYAARKGLPIKVFLPEYDKYGRSAPLKRNDQIVEYADAVYAFWDGASRGTVYTVKKCRALGKPVRVFKIK